MRVELHAFFPILTIYLHTIEYLEIACFGQYYTPYCKVTLGTSNVVYPRRTLNICLRKLRHAKLAKPFEAPELGIWRSTLLPTKVGTYFRTLTSKLTRFTCFKSGHNFHQRIRTIDRYKEDCKDLSRVTGSLQIQLGIFTAPWRAGLPPIPHLMSRSRKQRRPVWRILR